MGFRLELSLYLFVHVNENSGNTFFNFHIVFDTVLDN